MLKYIKKSKHLRMECISTHGYPQLYVGMYTFMASEVYIYKQIHEMYCVITCISLFRIVIVKITNIGDRNIGF
jgi:hypothetical protein